MSIEELRAEIRSIVDPEPDPETSGRDVAHSRLNEIHGLDISYLETSIWGGATVHPRTRLCPTGAPRAAYTAFERTWSKRCPGVVMSLREGGDELLTFFRFPKAQWKTLRTTNVIERLHGEFRRRVKTQGSLPGEDAAVVLLFSLVASGQVKLRKIDGWQKIGSVLSRRTVEAA